MRVPRGFALVACTCVVSLAAHSGEAPEAELKTAAVAAFKSGLAFVVKQGDVRLEAGVGNLSPVPNATLGSLWIEMCIRDRTDLGDYSLGLSVLAEMSQQ